MCSGVFLGLDSKAYLVLGPVMSHTPSPVQRAAPPLGFDKRTLNCLCKVAQNGHLAAWPVSLHLRLFKKLGFISEFVEGVCV